MEGANEFLLEIFESVFDDLKFFVGDGSEEEGVVVGEIEGDNRFAVAQRFVDGEAQGHAVGANLNNDDLGLLDITHGALVVFGGSGVF